MKQFFLCAALSALFLASASAQTTYSRVHISGTPQQLAQLRTSGLVDHYHPDKNGLLTELADTDIQTLQTQGYSIQILQADLSHYYAQRLAQPAPNTDKAGTDCSAALNYTDPTHFSLGSMGGYLTYTEILAELDEMAAQYPAIFKAKAPVSTFLTHEGRPLHWVKISDNPNADENEPRVFYNSLIHAREAITPMQLLYYMWYLLENYNSNPEIKYLLDNTEMYFIPVVNPDGYVYNQTTDPNGGGMHRKNKRPTGGNNPGVDLNRNFSYQWGVSGASTNPNNDTYMGPSAFSEPETQAIKWFAEQYDFTASLTHHSYANLLLWPYGYDNVLTPDNALLEKMAAEMVTENHFTHEQSVTLYPAAGDTDDWLYTATSEKPKVYALTPESGGDDDGFWPQTDRILPMCRANLKMNLDLARFVLKHGVTKAGGPSWITGSSQTLGFDFKRYGLATANFTVSLQSLSANATVTGAPVVFTNPTHLTPLTGSIAYTVNPATPQGTLLRFVLITDNGSYQLRDTVERRYGNPVTLLAEPGNNLSNWTASGGAWGSTTEAFVSPSSSITDSPQQAYPQNTTTGIVLANSLDLSQATHAQLTFWAKWDVEAGYDYVQLETSANGGAWLPLCGRYTKPGASSQGAAAGEPLYDGTQADWVPEEISLDEFAGIGNLTFRFRLFSDQAVTGDGFYFDDFTVKILANETFGINEAASAPMQVYPNPSNGRFWISDVLAGTEITVCDVTGQTVWKKKISQNGNVEILLDEFPAAIYFATQRSKTLTKTTKIILQK